MEDTKLDDLYRFFIFWHCLESDKNNAGELQNLYEDGWVPDMQSDEVIYKGKVRIYIHLARKSYL